MKSNYIGNKSDYNKIAMQVAREEVERQKAEICPACERSVGNQVAAVMCRVLATEFGFGKKRLEKLIDCTEGLFRLCATDGKRYCATQCIEWLKDSMGIDLEKE